MWLLRRRPSKAGVTNAHSTSAASRKSELNPPQSTRYPADSARDVIDTAYRIVEFLQTTAPRIGYRRRERLLFQGALVFLAGCRELAAPGWIDVAGAACLAGLLREFRLGRSHAGHATDDDADQRKGCDGRAYSEQD
jgi:hypothetical protein